MWRNRLMGFVFQSFTPSARIALRNVMMPLVYAEKSLDTTGPQDPA